MPLSAGLYLLQGIPAQSSRIAMETACNLIRSQSRVSDHDSSRRIIIFARELGFSLQVDRRLDCLEGSQWRLLLGGRVVTGVSRAG